MLQHLSIKNYALIDTLELELRNGFSVITGETGAGKSIILGALNLVLGKRADLKVLKADDSKCVVEGTFILDEKEHQAFFKSHDLDFEKQTIIRREILPSGKSRAFVNDTPVNLNVLTELAEKVIDVHSQHQNLLLSDDLYQLSLLDSFAKNEKELSDYRDSYAQFLQLQKELKKLQQIAENEAGDADYLSFLLNELNEAKLQPGEQEEIEEELQVLEHAEEIQSNLNEIIHLTDSEETNGVRNGLVGIGNALRSLSKFHRDYEELSERLESLKIEFEDVIREVELKSGNSDFEPQRLETLDARLSLLVNLQKKHALTSVTELIEKKDELNEKVNALANVEEQLAETKIKLQQIQETLSIRAKDLHTTRKKAAPHIEKQIMDLLHLLNMKSADFKIEVSRSENYTRRGSDSITFLFTANKGLLPQALSKVASGGEMSRVMLALKAIMAQKNNLPSIIFDEIDTGVSGETAGKIGMILKGMGGAMQVIAITHLPQIASMGQEHYKVVKEAGEDSTVTNIIHLNKDERLRELARLLSGEQISDAALANARTLLEQDV